MTVKELHTKAKMGMRVYYDALGTRNKTWGTVVGIDLVHNYMDVELEYSKVKFTQRFNGWSFNRIDISHTLFQEDLEEAIK